MLLSKLANALWTPSVPLASTWKMSREGLGVGRGAGGCCSRGFSFLVRLAWEARYLVPVMYAVFFFIFDIQMRLEIIIHQEGRVVVVEEEVAEHERSEDEESEGGLAEHGSALENEEDTERDESTEDEDDTEHEEEIECLSVHSV